MAQLKKSQSELLMSNSNSKAHHSILTFGRSRPLLRYGSFFLLPASLRLPVAAIAAVVAVAVGVVRRRAESKRKVRNLARFDPLEPTRKQVSS